MKKFFWSLFVIASTMILASCSSDDDSIQAKLNVTPTELNFKGEESIKTVEVEYVGSESWSAVVSDSWIELDATSGTGNKTITVTLTGENSEGKRNGTITFKSPGVEDVIVNVQQALYAITVTSTELEFPIAGGNKSIELNHDNADTEWVAVVSDSRISIDADKGTGNKTITVTLPENETTEIFNGEIEFSAPGSIGVTVKITQNAGIVEPEHISERTSWSRMKLTDRVHKLSLYIDITEGITPELSRTMKDLVFNEHGMITNFTYLNPRQENDPFVITYDEDIHHRIVTINGQYDQSEYAFRFEYGNHGKYIATREVMNWIGNSFYMPVYERVWMPALIKNLEKIVFTKVNPKIGEYDKMEMTYNISGNEGEVVLYAQETEGGLTDEAVMALQFDGYYPSEVMYVNLGQGLNYWGRYKITPINGYQTYYELEYQARNGEKENWVQNTFNADKYNTHASVSDFTYTTVANPVEPWECIYDARFNVVQFGPETIKYKYDERGNWIECETMHWSGTPIIHTRTIEYR